MENKKENMAKHYDLWLVSSLTKMSYCKANQIIYHQFLYFVNKQTSGVVASSGFTLLKPNKLDGKIEFHLPNGSYFALPSDCPMNVLQKLVSLC